MVNVLVVEDSGVQRKSLIAILSKIGSNLHIYESNCKAQSLKIIKSVHINLFFVDIDLNGSSGLDLAFEVRKLPEYKLVWIIFVTAYINYMIEGFKDIHCYDYIIKPYDDNQILKITKNILDNDYSEKNIPNNRKYVFFIEDCINIKIFLDEIIFLEVNTGICEIHTTLGKYQIKRLSLKKALEIINAPNIIKSHRAYAININYIRKIEKYSYSSWTVYFDNYSSNACIGAKYKEKITNALIGSNNLTNENLFAT